MNRTRNIGGAALALLLAAGCHGDLSNDPGMFEDGGGDSASAAAEAGAGSSPEAGTGSGPEAGAGSSPLDAGPARDAGGAGQSEAGTEGGSGGRADGGPASGAEAGAGAPCQAELAPAELRNTIDLTWQEMSGQFEGRTGARPRRASIASFRNTLLDQVMENGGKLNYCVRYESTVPVSAALRDKIAQAIGRGIDEWFEKLAGYGCFPFAKIDVEVVGWAVRDRATLAWDDDSVPIYLNDIFENAPQCAQSCGRFFHQQPGYDYPNCPGGAAKHYDKSLWLTEGMGFGGAGGDWGQRLDRAYFTDRVDDEHLHIFTHEIGHGFGFPDYYNWDAWVPAGTATPNSVMVAGRATQVTEWDRWMLRFTWDQLRARWP